MAPMLAEEWLKLEQALGMRPCLQGTAEEMFEQYNGLVTTLTAQLPPPDPSVSTKDGSVDGIKYRIYTPEAGQKSSLSMGIYTHGGGLIAGDLDSEDRLCRAISQKVPCILVSVDYRLGPKYKLPTMLQDSLKVAEGAIKNASSFGGDTSKVFAIGSSAGAGLALSIANHYAKTSSASPIKAVVALGPVTLHPDNVPAEYQEQYTAYTENATDVPVIDKKSMLTFFDSVAADPTDASTFTLLSPYLSRFPPTYIVTTGIDPLRDDGLLLKLALKKAGIVTKHDHYDQYPHVFWIFDNLQMTALFVENLITGIKWVVSSMNGN